MKESTIREVTESTEVIGMGTKNVVGTEVLAVWNGSHTVNIYDTVEYKEIDMFTFGHRLTEKSDKKEKAIELLKERGYTVFSKE